jgi:hypothetical protein
MGMVILVSRASVPRLQYRIINHHDAKLLKARHQDRVAGGCFRSQILENAPTILLS